MPEIQSVHDRLDSWKEIADYLKRDVRTVIRWEKEKRLPVHRVPGGQRQSVFAYTSEIDAWLGSHDQKAAVVGKTESNGNLNAFDLDLPKEPAKTANEGPFLTNILSKKRLLLGAVAGALALVGLIAFMPVSLHRSRVLQPKGLAQLTDDGRSKTNLRTDGKNFYFNELEVYREILVSTPVAGGPIQQIVTSFTNLDLQDVSNDGQRLLVTAYEGAEPERPLWIIPAHGGPGKRVGDVLCKVARWSPDNQRIACISGTSIMLLSQEGILQQALGPFQTILTNLIWSPDSKHLRFVRQDPDTKNVSAWEIPAGRGDARATALSIPWGENCCNDWAWTSDGNEFVYTRYEDRPALHVQSAKSAVHEDLLPVKIGTITSFTAGKDGTALYLLIQNANLGALLKLDLKRKVFETALPGLSATFLSYSRDGEWMTYVNYEDLSLWRSRTDGSEALKLTNRPMDVELSSWSPDGREIAFMAREPGRKWRIYLVSRDGGTIEEAAPSEDSQGAPTWSPDGNKLAYGNVDCYETQTCWIRTLNLKTKEVSTLPGSRGFRTARWSPDGKYIAAFQAESHELMLFDLKKRRWRTLAESVTGDNMNWSHDSKYLFADSPQLEKPVIERFRVSDGKRVTAVSLTALQKIPGQTDFWFGLTPDDSPILFHRFTTSEVYALNWSDH
jgi:Tol biopolymer transport system component